MPRLLLLAISLLTFGCATTQQVDRPQQAFFTALRSLCGQAFEGRVVTSDAADRDMASQRLVMHVRHCSADEVRIPFHVGENRSRTWIVRDTPVGLLLKHDHRHEDGTEDALTQYGGQTLSEGTARRQDFPADMFTLALFRRQQMIPNLQNVWAMEVHPGRLFAYELRRPNRHFRVEFDLTRPVPPPPPPWGTA
jgi:hypothetical protein